MPHTGYGPGAPTVRARLALWLPRGGGLSQADWTVRHRLVILGALMMPPPNLVIAAIIGQLDRGVIGWLVLTEIASVAGLLVRQRRVASVIGSMAALGACAGVVEAWGGVTEAHFIFFVAIATLALYRDWVPFLAFLIGTSVHHLVMAVMLDGHLFSQHGDSAPELIGWALVHGAFVLAAAAVQVFAWQLAEVERSRASREIAQAEQQFLVAFDDAPVAMVLYGRRYGEVLKANRALVPTLRACDMEHALRILAELESQMHQRVPEMGGRATRGEIDLGHTVLELTADDGTRLFYDVRVGAIRDQDSTLSNVLAHIMDVTQSRVHAEELRHQVRHDPLTGLLNRIAFGPDVEELLALHGRVALVLVDVNRFSALNDRYGREAGDALLVELAERLRRCAPEDALVARISGDQFAIAVGDGVEAGLEVAAAAVAANARPFSTGGEQIVISTVAGVATATSVEEVEHALTGAEVAAERAKADETQVQLYDDDLRHLTRRRIVAEQMLRDALAADPVTRLPVWFQPIVDSRSGMTIGAEALVRMRALDGGLVPPIEFIPVAEETGLVVPLGEHVLQQALHHLMLWGDRLSYVSVNVSPRQLASEGFVSMLAQQLADSGLQDTSRLVLEITETSLLGDADSLRERLDAIKALGVRIALDDFGTGYSSLTWLQRVPADIVKLDRSFVAGLAVDPDKSSIISAVIWLAKSLRMTVVAEGVEDQADAGALDASECRTVQGFLFGRPCDPLAFEQYLGAAPVAQAAVPGEPTAPVPAPRAADDAEQLTDQVTDQITGRATTAG